MMETIELHLQKQTLEHIRQAAAARHCTPEELIEEMLKQFSIETSSTDAVLGMFADEPELIDQVVNEAMRAREAHPLRTFDGQGAA